MNERLSALMDGELDGLEADLALRSLKQEDARGDWESWHLIGDVLRGDHGCSVAARVSQRLTEEPTVFAPRPLLNQQARSVALSAAASVAAVAVVGYLALTTAGGQTQDRYDVRQVRLAPQAAPVLADYMALHQGEVRNIGMDGYDRLAEAAR
jgi:sigma-E factor negative regulatory protein RseA